MALDLFIWTVSLAIGVVILVKGADLLVEGGGKTAAYFGIPPIVIGLTLFSFGTSLPELASSLNAVFKARPSIVLGNVIGSNIANILLVLGVSSLIKPIDVDRAIIKREIPIMFAAMSFLILFSFNSIIGRVEGIMLLLAFVGYIGFFVWVAISEGKKVPIDDKIEQKEYIKSEGYDPKRNVFKVILGLGGIVLGAELMIQSAVFYITQFGLSDGVVGLSIIAVATSLPELAASAVAAYREEADISLGNVIGSNTFNILMVLGICATFIPLNFSPEIIPNILIMIIASVLLTVFMYTGKKLNRFEGGLMLLGYFVYLFYLYGL
ncbi:MAG: calcium/sodium antiporter [Thermoplasmatota archaeon]